MCLFHLDLLNIIMIGLAKELPEHDETYELHRLLGALLSRELTIDEKLDIIGNEYDIPLEENFRKDMSTMCNLSQGVKEEGIAIGRREGLEEGRREGHAELITKMYKNGLSIEQIASATDKTVEEVRAIIEGKEKSQEA
jgi:flagellar biosynthesis/type III secretory pathway protein FliH